MSGRQLGLPVCKAGGLSVTKWWWLIHSNVKRQLVKFLIDTGAQISILTQQDVEKLPVQSRRQRFKITGVNGADVVCQTARSIYGSWVKMWRLLASQLKITMKFQCFKWPNLAPGEWQHAVLQLKDRPQPRQKLGGRILPAAPALPDWTMTDVPQYLILAAVQNGISDVVADSEKQQMSSRTHP